MPFVTIFLTVSLLQIPVPRSAGSVSRQQPAVPGASDTQAVATFDGKFKIIDKKMLLIEVEEGQTMRMYVTGSTKFFRDGKPARASDFHPDEHVTVEASRDARLNMMAVRVDYSSKPVKAPGHPADSDQKSEQ
jgi:hypothetical protein